MSQEHKIEVVVSNRLGMHLRAAVQFVRVANEYGAEITVHHGARTGNGKSIMSLATLAATQGSTLLLVATGEDGEAALEALVALVESKFGEE